MGAPSFFVPDGNPLHPAQVIGYFAEEQDLNEKLVFHWNPTSYKFKKSMEDESISTRNYFIESLAARTSKGIECTFELFLNEWDQQRAIQRTVEDSIGWLVNRMGPRIKGVKPGGNWLDASARAVKNHANQTEDPPVLVFIGLRNPFTCVMTDCEITSTIQRPNVTKRAVSEKLHSDALTAVQTTGATQASKIKTAALNRTAGGGTYSYNKFNRAIASQPKPGDIVRATLQITLKEWVPSQI